MRLAKPAFLVLILTVCGAFVCTGDGLPWLPEGAVSRMGMDEVEDLVFSHDGRYLAVAGSTVIYLIDMEWQQATASIPMVDGGLVLAVAFAPDKYVLTAGAYFAILRTWTVDVGATQMWSIEGGPHSTPVVSVAFSPDGRLLASGNGAGDVLLRDAMTGAAIRTLDVYNDSVTAIDFSPDGRLLATGGGPAQLWDLESGERLATLQERTGSAMTLDFSPDGSLLATGLDNVALEVWNVATGELHFAHRLEDSVTDVAFSPDGTKLVAVEGGSLIHVYGAATGLTLHLFVGHEDPVSAIAFSPDGATFVTGSIDGTLILWDATAW
ncbi:WD40 repeat domain-containing protein [Candidatus Bipolaricaulota bacterium]